MIIKRLILFQRESIFTSSGWDSNGSFFIWFLAAVASLARRYDLLQKVVPMDQSFDDHHAGIFRFRFWQYGKWVHVVVDDRLPTYMDGETLRFFGAQPTPENTYWLPLLEKAYAKLHGSYQAMERLGTSLRSTGRSGDAVEGFTGGIYDFYPAEYEGKGSKVTNTVDFDETLAKASTNKSLVTCHLQLKDWPKSWSEKTGSNHCIVKGFVSTSDSTSTPSIKVVRIRHSDESEPEESEITMTKKDFNQKCTSMEICHLNLKKLSPKLSPGSAKKTWQLFEIDGEWTKNSAGGPTMEKKFPTMEYNPRYLFKIEQKGNVIISLMQKHQWKKPLEIGYRIYYALHDTVIPYPLNEAFFNKATRVVFNRYDGYKVTPEVVERLKAPELDKIAVYNTKSAPVSMQHEEYTRGSNCRLELESGYYCLVITESTAEEGPFFLRIFSDNPITKLVDTAWLERGLHQPVATVTKREGVVIISLPYSKPYNLFGPVIIDECLFERIC